MLRELLILQALNQEPSHGYAIRQKFPPVTINNKTLYSTLNKFEKEGYVTKELVIQEKSMGKYIYTLQNSGRAFFRMSLAEFNELSATSWLEFLVRIKNWRMLETEDLRRIIQLREEYLKSANAYRIECTYADNDLISTIISSHVQKRVENELEYIAKLREAFCIKD